MSADSVVNQDKPASSSTGEPTKKELIDMLRDSGLYYELEFVPKGEETKSGAFKGSFPQSIVHHNIQPVVSLRTKDLEIVSKNGWKSATATFTKFNNPKLGKFWEIISKPVVATVSPKFDITLSDNPEEASKGPAGIPSGSKQYAFCAPFQIDWSSISEEDVPKDAGADLKFLRYGGYLYFGGDGELLDMTALSPLVGGMFRFRPPRKLGLECAARLKEAERLSPITTKGFPGAGYFAWVGNGDQGMPDTPLGAFVYVALDANIPALNLRMMLVTHGLYFQLNGTGGWNGKFPRNVQAFESRPTLQLKSTDIKVLESSRIQVRREAFKSPALKLIAPEGDVTGSMSPVSSVTLTDEQKDEAKIPIAAATFAFAYPFEITWEKIEDQVIAGGKYKDLQAAFKDKGGADQDLAFLQVGGFLYFDAADKLIHINAIDPKFHGAFKFGAPAQMWPEWVRTLEEEGRWCKVTIPALRKAGADRFAWLRPSKYEPNLAGFASEDGAFCYIGHSSRHPPTSP